MEQSCGCHGPLSLSLPGVEGLDCCFTYLLACLPVVHAPSWGEENHPFDVLWLSQELFIFAWETVSLCALPCPPPLWLDSAKLPSLNGQCTSWEQNLQVSIVIELIVFKFQWQATGHTCIWWHCPPLKALSELWLSWFPRCAILTIASNLPTAPSSVELSLKCFSAFTEGQQQMLSSLEDDELGATLRCACAGSRQSEVLSILLEALQRGEGRFLRCLFNNLDSSLGWVSYIVVYIQLINVCCTLLCLKSWDIIHYTGDSISPTSIHMACCNLHTLVHFYFAHFLICSLVYCTQPFATALFSFLQHCSTESNFWSHCNASLQFSFSVVHLVAQNVRFKKQHSMIV